MSPEVAERAAIMEIDGGIARPWAEWLAGLDCATDHGAYSAEQWRVLVDDAVSLVLRWGGRLRTNGWGPAEVSGLVPLIGGRTVTAIGRGDVTVQRDGFPPEKLFMRPATTGAARWMTDRKAA